MIRSRSLFAMMIVGMVMGLATLSLAWTATTVGPNGAAGASLSVQTNGAGAVWTARFDPGIVTGRRVYLQLRTIPTKMTQTQDGQSVPVRNWVDAAAWQTVAIGDPDPTGTVTFTFDRPLGVEHTYRAVANPGGLEVASNPVTYAAPQLSRDTGLATIYLNTNDGSPIDSTTDAWEGQVSVKPDAAGTCPAVEPVRAKLSGRGNSTWGFEKRPYNINLDKKLSLCGMPPEKKWGLLAEQYDRSLLRTTVAMQIGQGMDGMAWTPHVVSVDVYLNGEYQGLYSLIERVDVDPGRVNIDQLKNNQTDPPTDWNAAPTVTGGYLMEWDFRQGTDYYFNVGPRGSVSMTDPADGANGTAITETQLGYIKNYLTKVDTVLYSANFADPVKGWRAYIDEKSAVDYFIALEFAQSYDANMNASCYMYKVRDTPGGPGKLYLGPIWDFDTSMGAALYPNGLGRPTIWYTRDENPDVDKQVDVTWFNRLNQDPTFRAAVSKRWRQLKPLFTGLPGFVDARAALISKGAEANFATWDINDRLDPEQVIKGSWNAEVTSLKSWLSQRTAWMSKQLG